MRLTAYAPTIFPISRRVAKAALKEGLFRVNGVIAKADVILTPEDSVEYLGNIPPMPEFQQDDYLLFKNNDACFLYKPPFIHSERLQATDGLTMADVWSTFADFTPLSRLDYGVDGVVGGIKTGKHVAALQKTYLAITCGKFPDKITLKNSIDASNRKKVKVCSDESGYPAIMERIKFTGSKSLVKITLEKAARHQVRAFCAYLGSPILGDALYGGDEFERICLHCETYSINGYTVSSGDYRAKFMEMI